MLRKCYINVSDLAVCQRCPGLLVYKLHYGQKDAWQVGIQGSNYFYGSMFHKDIAQVFFEAAASPGNVLHAGIIHAVREGHAELEELVRRNIFMPFVMRRSETLQAEQLQAMARGVSVWIRAMSEFFRSIPSLMRYPEGNMQTVFIEPEQKLQAGYNLDAERRLVITGCYDALLFNPDKAEARLFEFKGYAKSDITVPLSQSLIYSWLIEQKTGIVPSVEIIYLDDGDKEPDVFSSDSVRDMMRSGLPELFSAAFDIISLRRRPEILRDKKLCDECKFNRTCKRDYDYAFMKGQKRRPGASLVSVMVFFMMAVIITAQVYFFTTLSLDDSIEDMNITAIRLKLENVIDSGKLAIKGTASASLTFSTDVISGLTLYTDFHGKTGKLHYNDTYHTWDNSQPTSGKINGDIYNLHYTFPASGGDTVNADNKRIFATISPDSPFTSYDIQVSGDLVDNTSKDIIFKLMSNDAKLKVRRYYLIRAYAETESGRHIMHQVLVRSSDVQQIEFTREKISQDYDSTQQKISFDKITGNITFKAKPESFDTLTYQEVWY